jgi:N-acetylneuraminic acid mutarotase
MTTIFHPRPAVLLAAALFSLSAVAAEPVRWARLAPLPDPEGFAYPFAGVHRGALLVAGGANFPGKRPWEGGVKVWYDTVFVLERPDGAWKVGGRLPRTLGYGVSISTPDGVLCLGGSDAERHHADAFLLRWDDGRVATRPFPALPRPVANLCGALLGSTVYLAGGITRPMPPPRSPRSGRSTWPRRSRAGGSFPRGRDRAGCSPSLPSRTAPSSS